MIATDAHLPAGVCGTADYLYSIARSNVAAEWGNAFEALGPRLQRALVLEQVALVYNNRSAEIGEHAALVLGVMVSAAVEEFQGGTR